MGNADHNIPAIRPVIRQLDEAAINRIAAGEVVERPASAVKELVENALDAGARRVAVEITAGGKTLIRVTDDGCGMTPEDLPLALSRHATSKIDGSDLLNIHSFGFRGEALPSLGAVGRLTITSRASGLEAARLRVDGGRMAPVVPAALRAGTVVELRDLFHATPARLKFLRSDRAEMQAVTEVVKRLSLAEPLVGFTLTDVSDTGERRELFRVDAGQGELFDALPVRIGAVLGREFIDNALRIGVEREPLSLSGFAALPTYSRGAAVAQFLFVNGRPVRDRLLFGALQAAYADVLPRGRYPAAVLFLDCEPRAVDVNVHPAKAEVRFRDPAAARGLIVSSLRAALAGAGHRTSSTVADATLAAIRPGAEGAAPGAAPAAAVDAAPAPGPRVYQMDLSSRPAFSRAPAPAPVPSAPGMDEAPASWAGNAPSARVEPEPEPAAVEHPLGAARAQLHGNWIVAQTATGMVIVDQHAAHERLTYEKLKRQYDGHGIAAQALLIPEILELGPTDRAALLAVAEELETLGLAIEAFGPGAVAVRSVPALLGRPDVRALVTDILDELADLDDSRALRARIDAILSRVACHGSIRSGRQMRGEEMNALLREMEATPLSGQCNHGRPTWVELKLSDIERLFGRS